MTSWYISIAEKISIVAYEKWNFNSTFGKYHFRITPTYNLADAVSMSQNISFEKYTLLISSDMARYNVSVYFQCYGNQLLYLQLIFMDFNDLKYTSIYQGKISIENLCFLHIFVYRYNESDAKWIFNSIKCSSFRNSSSSTKNWIF